MSRKTLSLALASALVLGTGALRAEPWAGSYMMPLFGDAMIGVDIDTRPDGRGISAGVQIDPGTTGGCFEGEIAPLCDVLDALRAGRERPTDMPYIDVVGMEWDDTYAYLVIDAPIPQGRFLVVLDRETDYPSFRLYAMSGELLFQGGPEQLPFVCDTVPCMAPVAPPGGWSGGLDWPSYRAIADGDGLGSAGGAEVNWDVQPEWTYDLMSLGGELVALGDGSPIGRLSLAGGSGTGTVRWPGGDGRSIEVTLSAEPRGPDGVEITLAPLSGRGEDDAAGRILLARTPAGDIVGTLIAETGFSQIRLVSDGAASDFVAPVDETHDAPGFGVSGPAYRMRNIPPGQSVKLRAEPSRTAGSVSTVGAGATNVLVIACTPEIDQWQFEESSPAARLAILDRLWCRVSLPLSGGGAAEGWIPGTYLEPM